ncbi:MAG: hypothetical protein R3B54_16205 [Bdellovibrionota bacterium]
MAAPIILVSTNLLVIVLTTWTFFGLIGRSAWLAVLAGVLVSAVGSLALARAPIELRVPKTTPVLYAFLNGLGWAFLSAVALFAQNKGNAAGLAIAVPLLCSAEFLFGAFFFLGLRFAVRPTRD